MYYLQNTQTKEYVKDYFINYTYTKTNAMKFTSKDADDFIALCPSENLIKIEIE